MNKDIRSRERYTKRMELIKRATGHQCTELSKQKNKNINRPQVLNLNIMSIISNIYSNMSAPELEYYQSKLRTLIEERKLEIKRDKQRLDNRMNRQNNNEAEVQAALENLEKAQSTLQKLKDLGASEEDQADQIELVSQLQAIYDALSKGVGNITDPEAQLLIDSLNDMTRSIEQKEVQLAEVTTMIENGA